MIPDDKPLASEAPTLGPPVERSVQHDVQPIAGYEILEELGRGGMGVVYKARQITLNRFVALKRIIAGPHAGTDQLARFRLEAEAVARLQHPHIVQIYEIGADGGHPFFSLEYVEGGSLAQRLDGKPVAATEAVALIETLARTMHYAHLQGVVHRDLKPANVLLAGVPGQGLSTVSGGPGTSDGTARTVPKITDFGLAKRLDEVGQTQSGSILGTPSYMAPEQAGGKTKAITARTDVYSLGTILYELLTGRPPFRAETTLDTLLLVLNDDPIPPSRLRPKLPRDLETICLKCLEKDPGRRYATAEALADDLTRFQQGEPILARPIGLLGRAMKWAQRRPAVASLSFLSVFITIVGFWLVVIEWRHAQRATDRAVFALGEADRNLYFNRIALADREWWGNNLPRAQHLLGECPRSLRNWEWGYLARLCQTERWDLLRAPNSVTDLAASHNGQAIATAHPDGYVRLWNAQGQPTEVLAWHRAAATCVAFSPDGRLLAAGGADGTIVVSESRDDIPRRGPAKRILNAGRLAIQRVVISSDGRLLAAACADRGTRIWELPSCNLLHELSPEAGPANDLAFSPDGRLLATGTGDLRGSQAGAIVLWDTRTAKKLRAFPGFIGPVLSLAFSPDGQHLATASHFTEARIWNVAKGEVVRALNGHQNLISRLVWSPDGSSLATTSWDRTVRIWEAALGREIGIYRGHTGRGTGLCFVPGSTELLSANEDGTVKRWQLGVGQDATVLRPQATSIAGIALTGDGRRLITAGLDGVVKILDSAAWTEMLSFKAHDESILAVAVRADGSLLATSTGSPFQPTKDGEIKVWDPATGRMLHKLTKHRGGIAGLAFAPDTGSLYSGGYDGQVFLWDLDRAEVVKVLHGQGVGPINALAISPDGRILAAPRFSGQATAWNLLEDEPLESLATGRMAWSAAFTPDSRTLLIGTGPLSTQDGPIKVWDVETQREVSDLRGHAGPVWALTVFPDGKRLASAGDDGTIKIWDLGTGRETLTLRGHVGGVSGLALGRDGLRLISGGRDRSIRVWEAIDPASGEKLR